MLSQWLASLLRVSLSPLHSSLPTTQAAIFAYIGLDIFSGLRPGAAHEPPLLPAGSCVCANETHYLSSSCVPAVVAGGPLIGFVTLCVFLVLSSRVFIVPPLCLLSNWMPAKRRSRIQPPTCVAIIAAGLRGAVAFALAKSISSYHRSNMTAATTGTVLCSTLLLGGMTRPLLTRLRLVPSAELNARERIKKRDDKSRLATRMEMQRKEVGKQAPRASPEEGGGRGETSAAEGPVRSSAILMSEDGFRYQLRRAARWLRHLDADVLRPMFIGTEPLVSVLRVERSDAAGEACQSGCTAGQGGSTEHSAGSPEAHGDGVQLPILGPSRYRDDHALRALDITRLPTRQSSS